MIVDEVRSRIAASSKPWFDALLARAAFVRIQNITDFLWLHEQDFWDLAEDFPCLASPWPAFWMEWRIPRTIRIKGQLEAVEDGGVALAVLGDMVEASKAMDSDPHPAAARWVLRLGYYSAASGNVGGVEVYVSETGQHVRLANGMGSYAWFHPDLETELGPVKDRPDSLRDIGGAMSFGYLYPALLAFSFCHAKNVQLESEAVPPKLQRARHRRGHVPVDRFYTLNIGPIQQAIRDVQSGTGASLRQALDLVRGHFKTYDATHKLFGKHEGAYFWGLHARGEAQAGHVTKTYNVVPS